MAKMKEKKDVAEKNAGKKEDGMKTRKLWGTKCLAGGGHLEFCP